MIDEEAIARINDSLFGLTAAVFSKDVNRVNAIGAKLKVGTVFMNRQVHSSPDCMEC